MKDNSGSSKNLAIVICNYNGKSDTVKCLESLNKSSYRNFEVYLVDDCSDNDEEKLDKSFMSEYRDKYFYSIDVVYTPENMGFAGANNIGISQALKNGPRYIALLNNDTIVEEDTLEILVSRLNNSSRTVVAPKILSMDKESKIWSAGGRLDDKLKIPVNIGAGCDDDGSYDTEKECFFLPFCACIIPAEVFSEGVGMLDESYYMYSEDVDYCIRLQRAGYSLLYIPEARIFHKGGASGVSDGSDSLYYSVRNECILRDKYMKGGKAFNEQLLTNQKYKYYAKKVAGRDCSNNKKMIEAIEAWKQGERGKRG